MRIRDLRYIPSLKVVTRLVFQRERPYRGKAATATALSTIWHKSTQCSTLRELRPPLSPHCLPSFAFLSLFPFPSMTCSSRVGREAAIRTDLPIINSTCLFHPPRARYVQRRLLFFAPASRLFTHHLFPLPACSFTALCVLREHSTVHRTLYNYRESVRSPMKGQQCPGRVYTLDKKLGRSIARALQDGAVKGGRTKV